MSSYDSWKTATPDQYENGEPAEDEHEQYVESLRVAARMIAKARRIAPSRKLMAVENALVDLLEVAS